MPDYEGKNQPPLNAGSWFSGFATWWGGLTPRYTTYSNGGTVGGARLTTMRPRSSSSAPEPEGSDESTESPAALPCDRQP